MKKPRLVRKSRTKSGSRGAAGAERTDVATRFYYKGSRLKQLRAFCMIVKLGTLSRAAEALFLSQPSVSLQLRALEAELGVALIERRRRRVAPTREGQALYELALPLVEGLETLDRRFHARCKGLAGGELRIAVGASTGQYLLPPWIAAFRARHPEVHVQLRSVVGSDGIAQLRSDQVDIAIGSLLDVPQDLAYEVLQTCDPLLIAPLDHPLAQLAEIRLEDLSPHGLVLPPHRQTTFQLVDLVFQQHKLPFHVSIEVGGWDVIKRYVAQGLGISVVPDLCVQEDDHARLCVRNLRALFPRRSYGVIVRKGKLLGSEARAFLDLLRPNLFGRRGDGAGTGPSER
ncbi:MAG: LysR family transcriptional regulator [Dokdonella sp.]|uniref:LysR family transcriptional regulator n=1 Tax=Dokdonella sp. TaxID=2291710 RepID=UPI0025BB20E4|nr:LysR family transcriptional regulator [Dokdonella sp.]MBX3701886.1 LysR family transcriptional regulator [Dokdonella sp.]MCW5578977.1 LysR family transcriptional regulator [Dokdonella sp.]